jgi:hypothetical protein
MRQNCHYASLSSGKFLCGVAPLRIETRRCLEKSLFDKAKTVDNAFVKMSKNEQLIFLFTKTEMIRYCAKTCFNILQRRLLFSCK